MRVKEFFRPTQGKLIIFVILVIINGILLISVSGYYDPYYPNFAEFFFKTVIFLVNFPFSAGMPYLIHLPALGYIAFFIYWYVITCCAVYIYKRFKERPKVLAGIILAVIILITVPIGLIAYLQFPIYGEPRGGLLFSSECINGNATFTVKNVNTSNLNLTTIAVVRMLPSTAIITTTSPASLSPGQSGVIYDEDCGAGNGCGYRISKSGRFYRDIYVRC